MVFSIHDYFEEGRLSHNDRKFLPGSGPGGPVIWNGEMGGGPVDCTSPVEIPSQGGEKAGRDKTLYTDGWDLGLPPDRIFHKIGRFVGNGDLYLHMSEYGSAVHFDAAHFGTLFEGGSEARLVGTQVVAVTGGTGFHGPVGSVGRRQGRRRGRYWRDGGGAGVAKMLPLGGR